jgi:hypothetical protein
MREGGLYVVEKGKKTPKRVEHTKEHKQGNRARGDDGQPLADMRRRQEAPEPATPAAKPAEKKE